MSVVINIHVNQHSLSIGHKVCLQDSRSIYRIPIYWRSYH